MPARNWNIEKRVAISVPKAYEKVIKNLLTRNTIPPYIPGKAIKGNQIMMVSHEQFVSFIRKNPDLIGNPVEGQTITAMQYLDSMGKVKAQAIYSSPVPGCKIIPCYTITEGV